jgi:hypothetical protein
VSFSILVIESNYEWSEDMALSGRIYKNVNSHWRLSIEWSASQNISNNSSTVTAKMYWEATDGYGAVYSSVRKDGAIIIDGSTYTFSGTGLARLSGNQKKLIATKSKTIGHNADGSKSFSIDGYFDAEVDISGWVGRINLSARSWSLNTIPRKSDIATSLNLDAGSNRTISIARASSSFSHRLYIDIKNKSGSWVNIKRFDPSSSTTTFSTSFSVNEYKEIFSALDGRSSTDLRWNLHTYNGSTHIGLTTQYGHAFLPSFSTINSMNGQVSSNDRDVYVDQNISIGIRRHNSGFDHKIVFTIGSFRKEFNGVETSHSWTPSSSDQSNIYGQIGSNMSADGNVEVHTYYNGVLIGRTDNDINFYVRAESSSPSFSGSGISYVDINTTTVNMTGNNKYIIQNKSELRVIIPSGSRASAKDGASMSHYEVTVNGKSKTANYSSGEVTVDFGTVNAGANTSVTVRAVDSRGLSASTRLTVNIIPYSSPSVSAEAKRDNGYESNTVLSVRGTSSSVKVGTSNKNRIQHVRYRYKDAAVTSWSSWANMSVSGFPSYTASNVSLNLDALATWNIQIEVKDLLGTSIRDLTVAVGRPILFLDKDKKSVGIGDFPDGEYQLKVNGQIVFGSTQWVTDVGEGEGVAGALYMNNSDITGINGLFFSDIANNKGEGLQFLKNSANTGSTNSDHYDTFYLRDGDFILNERAFMHVKPGNDTGNGLYIGAGGLTVIGAGESAYTLRDSTPDGPADEIMHITSDTHLYVHTNMNGGYGDRKTWEFDPSGHFHTPGAIFLNSNINLNSGRFYSKQLGSNEQVLNPTNGRLYVGNPNVEVLIESNGEAFSVGSDGAGARIQSAAIYTREYTGGSNVYVTGYGTLGRATSKRANKLEIEPAGEGKETDWAFRILDVEPRSWYDKLSTESLSNYLTLKEQGLEPDLDEMDVPYLERTYGVVAEEVEAAGLAEFVQYGLPDESGVRQIESVAYDRLWTLLIPVVREIKKQLDEQGVMLTAQEAKTQELEKKLNDLATNMAVNLNTGILNLGVKL